MRCARPTPPRTTRAMVRFGSSLSPAVTSLAAALLTALVAEPVSRPAGKQQPCCTSKAPGAGRGLSRVPGRARSIHVRLAKQLGFCEITSLIGKVGMDEVFD